jgi:hypothetical protein
MKNLELEGFGLMEMGEDEMLLVDGGSWFGDAIKWVVEHKDEIITVAIIVVAFVGAVASNI